MTQHAEEFDSALAAIRARRALWWLVLLTYVPAALIVSWLTDSTRAQWAVAFTWLAGFALSSCGVVLSRCPRCGARFHLRIPYQHPFTSRCLHCALPVLGPGA